MATEVLLMADVSGVGNEGEVVKVSDGYARNYLLPRNLGAPVNKATQRRLAKLQIDRSAERASAVASSRALASKLAQASCTITVKVGEGERLYGSVTEGDIVDALKVQGLALDRQQIVLAEPIKELGVFEVKVKLDQAIDATLKVWVVEE
ncbi:MAG: 50S ribosomal protein L9 [Lentisphaerae bacterium]|nr:50S ribosomal protein L9 [Lentisphaerota bacterium]